MKMVTAACFVLSITCSLAQKTVSFADSIRKAYYIPEINYAVVDANSTLEIAALGRHSIALLSLIHI